MFRKQSSLWTNFIDDLTFSLEIRKLLALAFVKEDKVVQYFELLMQSEFFSKAYDDGDEHPEDS